MNRSAGVSLSIMETELNIMTLLQIEIDGLKQERRECHGGDARGTQHGSIGLEKEKPTMIRM